MSNFLYVGEERNNLLKLIVFFFIINYYIQKPIYLYNEIIYEIYR